MQQASTFGRLSAESKSRSEKTILQPNDSKLGSAEADAWPVLDAGKDAVFWWNEEKAFISCSSVLEPVDGEFLGSGQGNRAS